MRSVNILVTEGICENLDALNNGNRSASVRDAASVVLEACAQGHEWVVPEILERVEKSSPRMRRLDEDAGRKWEKAIVWIPETMMREIERIGRPNGLRVSEFLRGVAIYATEDAAKNEDQEGA